MKKITKLSPFPIYPVFFGLFPVLFLWSSNRVQEKAYVVLPSLWWTFAGLVVIYLLCLAALRNLQRAAFIALLVDFMFLSFGHFKNLLVKVLSPVALGYLPLVFVLVMLGLIVLAIIRRIGSPRLTVLLNTVSVALVLFQVIVAAPYYMTIAAHAKAPAAGTKEVTLKPMPQDGVQRDVYFILLDNYSRQDFLLNNEGFDNSAFIQALKDRGFILPDCAQGNYFATAPVITSILNMDYLDKMGIKDSTYTVRQGYVDLAPLMQDSEVMRQFKEYGYHTVTFRGFMGLIDITSSDTYVNYENGLPYDERVETKNFDALYFKTTLISEINNYYKIYPDLVKAKAPDFIKQLLPKDLPMDERYYQVYRQNMYSYDELERIPTEIRGPKFVYAHIYTAHWPFMLKPDGSLRLPFSDEMTVSGYLDGVQFTNTRVLKTIDIILKNSAVPPIIIIQGDHSEGWEGTVEWSGKDRMKILSAYFLPGGGDKLLYKNISPVNNFRMVFQYYFGQKIDLLPDVSHYLDSTTKTIKIAPNTCISQSNPGSMPLSGPQR